jgi:hypothetical protein
MNARRLLEGLSFVAAIAMLVAALAYRAEAPPQPVAIPPVVDSNSELRNEKNSAQLQEQERMARLQTRF